MNNPQVGKIVGTVTDNQGETLPGVVLTVEHNAPRSEVSDANGRFRFLELPPGDYQLTAQMTGFNTYHQNNIIVEFGSTITIDPVLTAAVEH